jgi:hypothetical protein
MTTAFGATSPIITSAFSVPVIKSLSDEPSSAAPASALASSPTSEHAISTATSVAIKSEDKQDTTDYLTSEESPAASQESPTQVPATQTPTRITTRTSSVSPSKTGSLKSSLFFYSSLTFTCDRSPANEADLCARGRRCNHIGQHLSDSACCHRSGSIRLLDLKIP